MSQTETPMLPEQKHAARVVYFATGTLREVAADVARLRLGTNGTRLRLVAPAEIAPQLAGMLVLPAREILTFRARNAPLVWLRLMAFLGLSRDTEVLCLSSSQRCGLLKFLALTLRGRVVFSPIQGGYVPLSILDLAGIWIRRKLDAGEARRKHLPVGVIGSAPGPSLEPIVKALRIRYPQVPIHGLLLADAGFASAALFDAVWKLEPGLMGLLRLSAGLRGSGRRFQRWVVPCTNEGHGLLKAMAFLWPLRRRLIYNELTDSFKARDLRALWGHFRWRLSSEAREAARKHLPVGVVGSASGYYLKRIVVVLRARYPEASIHGLLLASAAPATAALFDSVQLLPPGVVPALGQSGRLWRARQSYQRWIIPCTDEPYPGPKFLAFLWPLRRRQIYNELADGFAVRNWRVFFGHLRWRLRDRMSFQILAGTAGRSIPVRMAHLGLYALRILVGVPLLLLARFRAVRNHWRPGGKFGNESFKTGKPSLVHRGAVAPRFPGEPDGSVGLK